MDARMAIQGSGAIPLFSELAARIRSEFFETHLCHFKLLHFQVVTICTLPFKVFAASDLAILTENRAHAIRQVQFDPRREKWQWNRIDPRLLLEINCKSAKGAPMIGVLERFLSRLTRQLTV